MYSLVLFGCPATTIAPEARDVDTDGDHVRRQQHVDRRRLALAVLARLALLGDSRWTPSWSSVSGMSLAVLREVSSSICSRPRSRPVRAEQAALHVVLDEPAHAAELAQRVEVADERHVRVGRLARLAVEHRPRRLELRDVHADQRPACTVDPGRRPRGTGVRGACRHRPGRRAAARRTRRARRARAEGTPPAGGRRVAAPGSARAGSWLSRRSPSGRTRCTVDRPTSHSSSTAVSYSPTRLPSGPLMRCSSSWMMRSGGRSGSHGTTTAAGSAPRFGWLLGWSLSARR